MIEMKPLESEGPVERHRIRHEGNPVTTQGSDHDNSDHCSFCLSIKIGLLQREGDPVSTGTPQCSRLDRRISPTKLSDWTRDNRTDVGESTLCLHWRASESQSSGLYT